MSDGIIHSFTPRHNCGRASDLCGCRTVPQGHTDSNWSWLHPVTWWFVPTQRISILTNKRPQENTHHKTQFMINIPPTCFGTGVPIFRESKYTEYFKSSAPLQVLNRLILHVSSALYSFSRSSQQYLVRSTNLQNSSSFWHFVPAQIFFPTFQSSSTSFFPWIWQMKPKRARVYCIF